MTPRNRKAIAKTLLDAAAALEGAGSASSAAFLGAMYDKPVKMDEMKTIILRCAISAIADGKYDDADTAKALGHLTSAYEEMYGKPGSITGDAGEQRCQDEYVKSGGQVEAFTYPDILADQIEMPVWLVVAVGKFMAEDDARFARNARDMMLAKQRGT